MTSRPAVAASGGRSGGTPLAGGGTPGPVPDLALQASRRARRLRLLGALFVAEPGPAEVAAAEALPGLSERFGDASELRGDYHRVLLAAVSPFESVFTSPDGQLGAVDPALMRIYRRFDIDWQAHRVAAGDHLGVQLLAYSRLCELEAEAWRDDRPDRAGQVVETERQLLASHVGSWAPAATEAIARAGAGTAYEALARLCDEVLAAEFDYLTPAAEHPDMPAVELPEADDPLGGSGRVARRLLAPARAGGFLLAHDVAPLAAALGAPWRPSDTRSRLRHVLDTALAAGRLEYVAAAFIPVVERWSARWETARGASPGAWRAYELWRLRAEATHAWLRRLREEGAAGSAATLVVGSRERLATVLASLSAGGIAVSIEPAPAPVRVSVDVLLRVEDGADDRWEGDPPAGAVVRLAADP